MITSSDVTQAEAVLRLQFALEPGGQVLVRFEQAEPRGRVRLGPAHQAVGVGAAAFRVLLRRCHLRFVLRRRPRALGHEHRPGARRRGRGPSTPSRSSWPRNGPRPRVPATARHARCSRAARASSSTGSPSLDVHAHEVAVEPRGQRLRVADGAPAVLGAVVADQDGPRLAQRGVRGHDHDRTRRVGGERSRDAAVEEALEAPGAPPSRSPAAPAPQSTARRRITVAGHPVSTLPVTSACGSAESAASSSARAASSAICSWISGSASRTCGSMPAPCGGNAGRSSWSTTYTSSSGARSAPASHAATWAARSDGSEASNAQRTGSRLTRGPFPRPATRKRAAGGSAAGGAARSRIARHHVRPRWSHDGEAAARRAPCLDRSRRRVRRVRGLPRRRGWPAAGASTWRGRRRST